MRNSRNAWCQANVGIVMAQSGRKVFQSEKHLIDRFQFNNEDGSRNKWNREHEWLQVHKKIAELIEMEILCFHCRPDLAQLTFALIIKRLLTRGPVHCFLHVLVVLFWKPEIKNVREKQAKWMSDKWSVMSDSHEIALRSTSLRSASMAKWWNHCANLFISEVGRRVVINFKKPFRSQQSMALRVLLRTLSSRYYDAILLQ